MKINNISIAAAVLVSFLGFVSINQSRGNSDESSKLEVTVRSSDLRVDKKKGEVIWEPDHGVKRATYRTYIFPLAHFKEKLGHPKDLHGEYKLKIQTRRTRAKNYVPDDPSLQQPVGGFNLITFTAKILEKLS